MKIYSGYLHYCSPPLTQQQMAKAKILEKIRECWNDVNVSPNGTSHIQSNDKVKFYKLSIQEKSHGEIFNLSWNNDVNDCSNIIILRRGKYSSIHPKYFQYFCMTLFF